jgi:hypothetical protein
MEQTLNNLEKLKAECENRIREHEAKIPNLTGANLVYTKIKHDQELKQLEQLNQQIQSLGKL